MERFLRGWTWLIVVTLVFGRGSLSAQGTSTGGLKANLDLPYEAVGEAEEEAETPEAIVFYGQMYEGTSFIFCADKMC